MRRRVDRRNDDRTPTRARIVSATDSNTSGSRGYAAPADTKVTLLGTRGGASLNKDLPTRPIW